jgi:putative ABC transport system substrate-binding protein
MIGLRLAVSITVALVGLFNPLAAGAQQTAKIARIGFLATDLAANPHLPEAFRQGLRDLGYVEGRNVVIEYRDAEGKIERLPALAAELAAPEIDVIVAPNTPAALAAKQATRTLPLFSSVLVNGNGPTGYAMPSCWAAPTLRGERLRNGAICNRARPRDL